MTRFCGLGGLTVRDASSTYLNLSGGQYTGLGQLYNPANTLYGGVYLLTTKDGTVYEIDAISGDLLKVTDTNGNSLTYTDSAITSSTGQTITFERDGQNRIRSVRDPVGELIRYDYNEKGDLIKVVDREANTTQFKYDADPQRAHYLKEVIDPLNRTGARAVYDEQTGRLKQIFDVNGNDVELIYDPANSVQIVKDTLGKEMLYEYDPRGNIVRERDPEGREIRRGYDAHNNVLQETVISDRSDSNPNDDVLVGFTTKYTYDGSGNKLSEETGITSRLTLAGQLLNEVSTGSTTRFTYGSLNRLATETDALGRTTIYGYDRRGNLTSTRDAMGQETRYGYALNGQLFSVTDANQKTTEFRYDLTGNVNWVKDALGNVTEYEYDGNGNKTKETRKSVNLGTVTSQDLITTWSYDSNGRVRTVTDALNSVTAYGYDKAGNQTWVLDGRGYLTEYRYTDKGELRETRFTDGTRYRYNPTLDRLELLQERTSQQVTTQSEYDAAGRRTQETDQSGRVTRFEYDDAGRLVTTIYPDATPTDDSDNPLTRTEYFSDGTVKAQIDERGNRTEFRYDSAGRQIEVIGADETPNDPNDNPRTRFTYDQAGQQTAVTDALNFTTRYRYDDLGRQWKTEFADGSVTSTEYDALGRRTAAIDPNGKRTEYRYDALGRLTGVKDARSHWTEYGYNGVGNLLWQEDANDHRTTYAYDALGRRSTVTLPLAQQSTSTYDAVGNLKTYTDFNGKTTTYTYNPLNQLQSKLFASDPSVSFTYTPTGMRSTILDSQGTTVYEYDEHDRLTKRTDPDGRSISYEYDAAGNRTKVTTPSGTVNYTFDAQNRLDQVWQSNFKLADYTYNAVGSLIRTQFANGTEEVREYDSLHRLKKLENQKGNTVLSRYAYTLDKAGNRTKVDELGGRSVTYTYDDLYRLTREAIDEPGTGSDRTFEYGYDNVGNRLWKREKLGNNAATQTNYTYDNNDRLSNETVNGQVVAAYTYDNNGNTKTKIENGILTEYTWNDGNRLVGLTLKNASTGAIQQQTAYVYNTDGIRVATIQGEQITRFLVDANRDYAQVLEEYSNGQMQTSYVYGLDLISQTQHTQPTQNTSYYLVDGLGSTRLLTDGQGNVLNSYTYEAFGETIKQAGSTSNQYLFAGEQLDKGTGDYYLRDRFYDSSTGRFTRRDVYEGRLNDPLTLHKYGYTHNNPVNNTDPTGLFTMAEVSAANSIRDILNGIQIENGQKLVGMTLGERLDPSDFVVQGLLGLGILASVPLLTRFAKNTFAMRALTQRYKFFAGNEAFEHFTKHGDEVMKVLGRTSYNVQDFIEDANSVIKTGTWVPEMNGYVQVVGGTGKAKAAFVGVRRDNTNIITTFHVKSVKEVAKKSPSLG